MNKKRRERYKEQDKLYLGMIIETENRFEEPPTFTCGVCGHYTKHNEEFWHRYNIPRHIICPNCYLKGLKKKEKTSNYKKEIWFFQCNKCGEWTYTPRIIKVKKCLKCGNSIKFEKAEKYSLIIHPNIAPKIMGELKIKGIDIFRNMELRK